MRIILAIDGSEQSDAAADAVTSRQWPGGSIIRLLTVVRGVHHDGSSLAGEAPTFWDLVHEVNEDALRVNIRSATLLRDAGIGVEIAVARGDPRMAIVEDARSWSADLVVLGGHGRTAARSTRIGSVAQHVLLHAACLVDIVLAEQPPGDRTANDPHLPLRGGATPDRLH